MAISWKGPQHGTPYQEIATACGLAMTCLWEHGADSSGCVGDFGAVLRNGTQAVPYGMTDRESRRDTPPGVSGLHRFFA